MQHSGDSTEGCGDARSDRVLVEKETWNEKRSEGGEYILEVDDMLNAMHNS